MTAYEVDLGGILVAIKAFNGAGYANWIGQGRPVAINAHLQNGDIESVPFFAP